MKKMKRLLSVLLCALLVCAFAPITASAIGYIYEVDITGVDAPVAGELPDTEVSVNEQCDAEVMWYDRTDKCEHDLSKPFKAGHSYQVIVTLTPHEGVLFNYDTSDYDILDITAKINGEKASVASSYGGEVADVFKNYDELSQIINKVTIGGLTTPVTGATPDFSLTLGTGYTLYPTDGITWYDYTDSKTLTSSDKFVTGHEYGLVIVISAGQGYEFKVYGNKPAFDAKIGNLETSVNWYYPQDPKKVASIAVKFGIIPGKVSGLSASNVKTTSMTLKWMPAADASEYEIYRSTDGRSWKKIGTNFVEYFNVKSLKPGTIYKFKVRAVNGNTAGVYSAILTQPTKPTAVKLSSVTAGKKKATVKWKKVSGATGYEILYSTRKSFKSAKTATIKNGSTVKKTIKSLKSKKTYYFKVRAYKTAGSKKVYGAYGSYKKTKIK